MDSKNQFFNIANRDRLKIFFRAKNLVKLADALGAPLWLYSTIITTKNWYDVVLFMMGLKRRFDARYLDGEMDSEITQRNFWFYKCRRRIKFHHLPIKQKRNFLELLWKGKNLRFFGECAAYSVEEIFFSEPYKKLSFRHKTVVDIGGNIGDSALYFSRGAKKVVAIEPYPYAFGLAKKNVKANRRENIVLVNAAVGAKRGKITLDKDYQNKPSADLKSFNQGETIPIVTLSDIAERFLVKDAVLKIDVEGGEYAILLDTPDNVLRRFEEIILEYHHGYLDLEHKLRGAGFDVDVGSPSLGFNKEAKRKIRIVGILHAHRRNSMD